MAEVDQQPTRHVAPTPSSGQDGQNLRTVANQIQGLLDDDGHYNPNPDQLSRGHPDYDESTDPRNQPRDDRGRFKGQESDDEDTGDDVTDTQDADYIEDEADDADQSDDRDADTDESGDTDDDLAASAVDETDADAQDTEPDIDSLQGFAEALEVPLDELKEAITHTFNAAGEEVTVTLAELEAGYQKDADYRRNTGKLAEDRRLAETDYASRMQAFDQEHVFLANQFNVTEQLLAAELNSPALAALRDSDPAEWTARREEIGQRLAMLRDNRQQAANQYQQFQVQQQTELKQREMAALTEVLPDFGQQHRAIARQAMESIGYTDPEIKQVTDHRLILGALELASLRAEVEQLRGEKAKAKDTVKRVKKEVPKLTKPGRQRNKGKGAIKRDNVQRLRNRAAKSGTVEDAAKVIEQFI